MRRTLVSALLTVSVAASAACSTPGDAAEVYDQGRIVDGMASSIDEGTTRSFTAEYTLTDNGTAVLSHMPDPYQDSLVFGNDSYVSTPQYQLTCGGTTCVETDALAPTSPLDVDAIAKVSGPTFIAPQTVLGLLTKAALDTNATIEQSDGTFAGEHGTCASVTGLTNAAAATFTACITDRGVLGKFDGTVDGVGIHMLLVSYTETAEQGTFDVPANATVKDQREKK